MKIPFAFSETIAEPSSWKQDRIAIIIQVIGSIINRSYVSIQPPAMHSNFSDGKQRGVVGKDGR